MTRLRIIWSRVVKPVRLARQVAEVLAQSQPPAPQPPAPTAG